MTKLKVGVVGCGFIAQKRHIPGFLRLRRDVSIHAICDMNQGLAKEAARKFGIHQVYSNLSQMLSKEDLDIVDICTPPQVHSSIAVESMKNGCHVLLEKPMALGISDCEKMIQASQKYGVKLSVVHNQRFYPPFIKTQQLVENGAIGKLTGMRILSLTHRDEYMARESHWVHRLPGGVVGEAGPHSVYMSLAFLKNVRNVSVYAKKTLKYPWVLYDDYRIELEGGNINSSIIISHANSCATEEVDLFGTEGIIKMDLHSMLLILHKRRDFKPTSLAISSFNTAGQIIKGVASNALMMMLGETFLGHYTMIEKFVESIMNDQPVPVTPEEGRETVRVMEMIIQKLNKK